MHGVWRDRRTRAGAVVRTHPFRLRPPGWVPTLVIPPIGPMSLGYTNHIIGGSVLVYDGDGGTGDYVVIPRGGPATMRIVDVVDVPAVKDAISRAEWDAIYRAVYCDEALS